MSWSKSAGPVPFEELAAALQAAPLYGGGSVEVPGGVMPEVQEQVDVTVQHAMTMLTSGAFGDLTGMWVGVSLNGHANQDHKAVGNWAWDTGTVSVYVRPPVGPPPDGSQSGLVGS